MTMASNEVLAVLYKQFPTIPRATIREFTEIEGFNDSQALAGDVDVDRDLGPLARLYIVPRRYEDSAFVDQWKLSAVLEVEGAATMPNSYRNLGIKDNPATAQYCVFLTHRTAGDKWIGSIAPVAGQDCTDAASGKQLNVGLEEEPGASKADFPSVVRIDEDKNGKAIIGVNCGEKTWCEIGRNPGNGERRAPAHASLPVQTRQHRIKSWHDEQEITTPDTLPSGVSLKRAVRASITPNENLGGYTVLDFTSDSGATVATIFLEKDPRAGSKYYNWGLRKGNNSLVIKATYDAIADTLKWSASFRDENGNAGASSFRVDMMAHKIKPPAVARWKWNPKDEDIWVACDQGCCTVTGFTA
jgi:hypothetical protein